MEKLKIKELIIVEGKYDKIRLENIVDATVIAVNGFGIYNDSQLRNTLKSLAGNGVIILTDSDTAGYKIRVYLSKILSSNHIYNVFLPQIAGKEHRKVSPSAEGFLGVEGISDQIIRECLLVFAQKNEFRDDITMADLYTLGYSGSHCASERKNRLLQHLGIQKNISNRFLLRILNDRFTKSQFFDLKL